VTNGVELVSGAASGCRLAARSAGRDW